MNEVPTGAAEGRHSAIISRWRAVDTWHLLLTVAPGVAWIVVFLVLPSLFLISIAFMTNGVYGLPQMPLTLHPFVELGGSNLLGWSPANIFMVGRSAGQALVTTALVIAMSYPIVHYITSRPARWRPLLLLAVVAPSWTNQVIRVIGWMDILSPHTWLSNVAATLGFIAPEMGLFPSNFAVGIGLVYNFLPFMVLPLYASYERLDQSQVDAARDLGAGPVRTFLSAIVPQTVPGLVAGAVLVSIPAFGMYVVPELLGGSKSLMIGSFVARQFASAANWPLGAAGALLIIVVSLIGLKVLRSLGRRASGGVEVIM